MTNVEETGQWQWCKIWRLSQSQWGLRRCWWYFKVGFILASLYYIFIILQGLIVIGAVILFHCWILFGNFKLATTGCGTLSVEPLFLLLLMTLMCFFATVITVTINAVDIIAVLGGCHTFAQKDFTQLHTWEQNKQAMFCLEAWSESVFFANCDIYTPCAT